MKYGEDDYIENIRKVQQIQQLSKELIAQTRILALKGPGYVNIYQGYDKITSAFFSPGQSRDLVTQTVSGGSDGVLVLLKYANYTSDIAAWGLFTWNMYIDNVQIPEYSNISDQYGLQYQMRDIGIDIVVKLGQTLRIEVVASSSMPVVIPQYTAGVSLIGVYGTLYRGVL